MKNKALLIAALFANLFGIGAVNAAKSEANRALAATLHIEPPKDNESDAEDLILGFRGKFKYQIVVPDPMPNEAAAGSVGRAAELLQAAFSSNGIMLEVKKESALRSEHASYARQC